MRFQSTYIAKVIRYNDKKKNPLKYFKTNRENRPICKQSKTYIKRRICLSVNGYKNSFRCHFLGTFTSVSWVPALFSWVLFYRSMLHHICICTNFYLSAFPSKTIRQTHCNIPAGGADAAAVGAIAFVGDILERCIEREAARKLQRCAQIERKPRR